MKDYEILSPRAIIRHCRLHNTASFPLYLLKLYPKTSEKKGTSKKFPENK